MFPRLRAKIAMPPALRARLTLPTIPGTRHVYRAELLAVVVLAAPLTTGAELKDWILIVVGNLFAAFLAIRALGHFLKNEWGQMVTLFVAAVAVGAVVWAPDTVQGLLTGIADKVTGTA